MERWNWMLGTGLYLDGIRATLEQLDREAQANIARTMWGIAAIAVFGVALISACALALNLSEHRQSERGCARWRTRWCVLRRTNARTCRGNCTTASARRWSRRSC